MNGPTRQPLLPLLSSDADVVAYFLVVADIDATDPADFELEEGVRLASRARLEQFARASTGDAYCFVGEGGEERPVVYVSLDGEAGPIAVGLPELLRLGLAAPWWRDGPGRTDEQLRASVEEFREYHPDIDERRHRAARALGLDPLALPPAATALAGLAELSRGPVAAASLVVGPDGDPFDPLFDADRD
ncbi:hypothetical protein ACIHEI_26890 [Kitasatospora sp. NPDC051984]|uniref:hypothetical protein n=1 Tax=Kitasatospora sp. NPDC051984 TaxID=3364059 RepID=UPI0037CCB5A7